MIFLSHTAKDKPIVEQIANNLSKIFKKENIFYDSWSIQPGDGIIDKMDKGLQECLYFFFFISENSLKSKMVTLEWQNALMKATKGEIKFIPVKLDNSRIPTILTQSLYIDLYNNGLEVALRQMIDVINGTNTYHPQFNQFSNIHGYITKEKDFSYLVEIRAEYFLEPTSLYCVLVDNDLENIVVSTPSDSVVMFGEGKDIVLNNGEKHNAIFRSVFRATTPNYPFSIKIESKNKEPIKFVGLMHSTNNKNYQYIPVHFI